MQFNLRGQISRVFRIGERRSADLQFAATNALNHVTYSGFNTTVGANSLGLLTGPSAMRSLTATLRFRF
jgi:trimeric autotransporter adhesin